ncbi:MAG: FAD-dependent oxidoreductase [Tolypothrix carrinoi HA7290-LM1]|jgi:NADPH-dependent 2,4-dienoyl-CoA reductase/sulfur reductase-like enzyme/nitrite reductase/ring-hydroxylating ferredoxin subunit|nr:FAD-dependent oxidoreductase [Tolypothrix carrinoi HA7290-LM1]
MQQIEAVVAKVNDLQDGEKRQVSVGDTDVLLIRVNQNFHAVGAFCTHYQAPLAEGVLSGNNIVCPWHNAYFNITTGDQQEPPGLDSLPCYQVRIEGENVIVSVPEKASGLRTPAMASYNPNVDSRTFIILGAGAAGAHAAETLRTAGYQGRILMITREDQLPYDRTVLSKDYFNGDVPKEQVPLRTPEFYKQHNIEVLLNKQATNVDAKAKKITFEDGETLSYDALLLATGGKPKQLEVEGADLENVFTLRSFADSDRILASAQQAKQAVVIGSSFIGMETASGLTQKNVKVTVISPDSLPFKKILGEEIGHLFQQVHEENGVSFQFGRKVTKLIGNSKVEAVILDNNQRLEADIVVVGIGVQPATQILSGVDLHPKDKSIPVDEYLRAADNLYAAGDIARFPDERTNEKIRVEHWRIAAQQGRIAAYNMLGKSIKFKTVPVFWTMQFDFPLRYVGHAEQWDEIIIDGDLQKREFIVFYIKDNQVLAAATSQRDTETAAITELMRLNKMPNPETLRQGNFDLIQHLHT